MLGESPSSSFIMALPPQEELVDARVRATEKIWRFGAKSHRGYLAGHPSDGSR